MTVRQRVAQLEKAQPDDDRRVVVLFPGDDEDDEHCIDDYCAEHGVSRDEHMFLCISFVEPPARAEE